jgi:hypothetical protein
MVIDAGENERPGMLTLALDGALGVEPDGAVGAVFVVVAPP